MLCKTLFGGHHCVTFILPLTVDLPECLLWYLGQVSPITMIYGLLQLVFACTSTLYYFTYLRPMLFPQAGGV